MKVEKTKVRKIKLIALFTIFVIIANMFSPYGILINEVLAASASSIPEGEAYFILELEKPQDPSTLATDGDGYFTFEDWNAATQSYYTQLYNEDGAVETIEDCTEHGIRVNLYVTGGIGVNTVCMKMKLKNDNLVPAYQDSEGRKANKRVWMEPASTFTDFVSNKNANLVDNTTPTYSQADKTIYFNLRSNTHLTTSNSDKILLMTFEFRLKDGLTPDDLTSDMFDYLEVVDEFDGVEIDYYPYGNNVPKYSVGADYVVYNGFKEPEVLRIVTDIAITGTMTKKYIKGEDLDFSELTATLTYNNGDTETITDIAAELAKADSLIKVDTKVAKENGKVIFTPTDKNSVATTDVNYYTATGLSVSNLSKMTYNHGDTVEYKGSTVKVIYTYGDGSTDDSESYTIENALANGIIREKDNTTTVTKTTTKLTFLYTKDEKITAELPITVNDPIDRIEIDTYPNQTYNAGDTITLTGGKLKAITRSGTELPDKIDMSGGDVRITSSATANLADCTTTWDKMESGVKVGTAGTATVNAVYTDTDGKEWNVPYTITVNDTISSISINTGINADVKNKYGTVKGALDLTGATIHITTGSGGGFDVSITTAMLTGTYNPNTLNAQNVQVTYAGKTTGAGAGLNITLENYIKGVEVTGPANFEVPYNQEPDYSQIKFKLIYADGTKSAEKSKTDAETVSGYNKTPTQIKTAGSHKYAQTNINFTYNTPEKPGLDVMPAKTTFTITTVDTVKGIKMHQSPNKMSYTYGETFNVAGGYLVPTYESGAVGTSANAIAMQGNSNVAITDGTATFPTLKPDASKFTNGKATITLNVTYTDPVSGKVSTTTLPNVIVNDVLQSLIVTNPLDQFDWGDTIGIGSGTIKAVGQSGADITINEGSVEFIDTETNAEINMEPAESQFNTTTNSLPKTIKLSYTSGGTTIVSTPYSITINNPIKKIIIDNDNKPKDDFEQNEAVTGIGGKIIVVRKATNPETSGAKVDIQDSWVSTLTTGTVTGTTPRNATVTYTVDGKNYTTTYPYYVTNEVKGIVFDTEPTKKLQYGKTFAATGTIKLKTSANPDGEPTSMPIQTAWVTQVGGAAVDMNTLGTQNLVVTYTADGQTYTLPYQVEVQDYVKSVKITPATLTGDCGKTFAEIFASNSAKVTVTMAKNNREYDLADGDASLTALINALSANYKNNVTTNQALTAKWTDNITDSFTKGTEFNVNVAVTLGDVITAIEKVEDPELIQDYDTAFNIGSGKIRVKTISNPTGTVENINPAWIKEEDGDEYDQKSAPGVRNIKLVYPGFTGTGPTYSITVKTSVKDITISPDPYTNGVKGMTLDKLFEDANFTYTITYNGTTHTQTGSLDKTWLTGTYDPQSTTQTLEFGITDNYEHSRTKDTTVTGEVTIVLVSDSIQNVVIETNPEGTQKYDTAFDVGEGKVTVTNASGTSTTEAINKSWIKEMDGNPYNSRELGTRQLQVVYPGYTSPTPLTFTATVKDYVKEVKVTPATLTGDCGKTFEEIFSENSAKVNVIMAKDNRQVELTGTELANIITALKNGQTGMNNGYKNNVTTTQNLTATYTDNIADSYTNGETRPITASVKLEDKIDTVAITTAPTEIQRYGEPLDLGNGKITVTNIAGGAGTPIPIDPTWVTEMDGTPYDNTLTTERKLKVNYPGYTGEITFDVDVRTEVESVTISPSSVTAFIGNTLDDVFANNTNLTYQIKYKGSNDLKTGILTKDMTTDTLVSTAAGTKTINFTVPDNYDRSITNGQNAPKQGKLTVNIVPDAISTVTIKTAPTEDQQYGEKYKPGTGTIDVTMASGDVLEDVAIDPEWIKEIDGTDYNPNKLGTRKVLVKYPGHDGVEVSVNVKDYITGITATPKDFTGNCGTPFETIVSGIKFKVSYKSGKTPTELSATDAASLIQAMKASYKPTSIAKETINFSYTDTNTANFLTGTPVSGQITVKLTDVVTGITIETNPQEEQKCKMDYQPGSGMITIKTANNPTGTSYPIEKEWIKELDGTAYNSSKLGARNVKIVHPDYPDIEIGEVPVNVKDWVQTYEIHEPTNTKYSIGDTVEDRDGYIVPVKASGAKDTKIDLDDANITLIYSTSTPGTKLVEIEYNGKNIGNFSITVTDGIEYIKMGKMPKTKYLYGDALSTKTPDGTEDATIIIKKYSDAAEKEVPLKNCTLSGYDSKDISGKQTIKVSYDGGETSFEVLVEDYVLKIGVSDPVKKTYKVGSTKDDLDITGLKVWEVTASGKKQNETTLTLDMITDFDSSKAGTTQVEVTYNGMIGAFPVTIEDAVKDIRVKQGPTQDEYRYGESLKLAGAILEIEKDSGVEEIDITNDMVSGYNANKLGEQELTVTYEGQKVGIITVIVKDYVKGISVNIPKKTYTQGEKLDLTGATVKVMTASGKVDEEAQLTLAMIDASTPFDTEKIGTQTLKINYGKYTTTATVTVKKKVVKDVITLEKGPDKKTYKQGESLDLTGAMLKVVGESGTSYIYATSDMSSGYDAEKVGEQTITLTYKGTKLTFKVTVVEREKPVQPETPVTPVEPEKPTEPAKPETPVTPAKPTKPVTPTRPVTKPTNTVPQEPVVVEPAPEPTPTPTPAPVEQEKPTVVLGVEDEKDDDMVIKAALLAGLSGMAILALLAATKRNVQVFVEEDGEYCFGGAAKVSRKNRRIDVNKFLDENTANNKVKIVLTDKIAKALNGYELEVRRKDTTHRIIVNYEGRPFEVILK